MSVNMTPQIEKDLRKLEAGLLPKPGEFTADIGVNAHVVVATWGWKDKHPNPVLRTLFPKMKKGDASKVGSLGELDFAAAKKAQDIQTLPRLTYVAVDHEQFIAGNLQFIAGNPDKNRRWSHLTEGIESAMVPSPLRITTLNQTKPLLKIDRP